MSIEIIAMTLSDYDDCLALWQATEGMGLSQADRRESIGRYLARNPGMSFVARGADGALLGAVLCGHDGRRGMLHHLAVRADCRSQGLGRALVACCMAALEQEGIDKCHLMVFEQNAGGRVFWQRTGWYERPELVLMSRNIP
jgi:putative acetyltransferase